MPSLFRELWPGTIYVIWCLTLRLYYSYLYFVHGYRGRFIDLYTPLLGKCALIVFWLEYYTCVTLVGPTGGDKYFNVKIEAITLYCVGSTIGIAGLFIYQAFRNEFLGGAAPAR